MFVSYKSYLLIALTLFFSPRNVSGSAIFCYYDSSSIERSGLGRFGIQDLPTSYCTHVVYAFLGLTLDGNVKIPPQKSVTGKTNNIKDFAVLVDKHPQVTFMVAIGGYDEGSTNFSEISANPNLRSHFVDNVMSFLEAYGLHGIDLQWQFPGQRGGLESDKDNFSHLLKDLRSAMGDDYELTVSVGVKKTQVEESYNIPAINYYVDYINLMTYDYHGLWDLKTGVNAPLYPQTTDLPHSDLNVNASVHSWVSHGATPSKLVLGLAPFGKTFHLTDINKAGTGADYFGAGCAGPYTQKPGYWATYEICQDQKQNPHSWKVHVAPRNSYAYANKGLLWLGYDTPKTFYTKGEYAKLMGLGGVMFWSVDLDDFNGECGSKYIMIRHGLSGFFSE